jgi:hypothetical protein
MAIVAPMRSAKSVGVGFMRILLSASDPKSSVCAIGRR